MSLVSTLAKVAIGVAIAKGVSHVSKNGLPGAGTASSGSGRSSMPKQSGGLADMMGDLLGTKSGGPSGANAGGLGGLLEQLGTQNGAKRPTPSSRNASSPASGIEDLLGSLTGGAGGLGGLLGGLTGAARGAAGGTGGGLGDMLGSLLGAGTTSGSAGNSVGNSAGNSAGGIGGLGGMLNDIMAGNQPTQTPNAHQEVAAALMLKAMVQAAKSDGKLDQSEKQKLMDSLGDADPQEIAFVNDLLAQPVDVAALVDAVPRGLEEQVYLMSLMAIDLDSQHEAQYLHDLASALGLDKDLINAIHHQAGAQPLYS